MQNNKKVGIITIHDDINYGNRLQCWALQFVLKKLGVQAEELRIVTIHGDKRNKKWKEKRPKLLKERAKQFDKFTEEKTSFKNILYKNKEELCAVNSQYDLFIAGSDQIWNPYFITNFYVTFLNFADKEKRASYAASIAISKLPLRFKGRYKKALQNFEYLSLREEASKTIVDKLLKENVACVNLDPTLLVNKQDWIAFCQKEQENRKPYILTYFLGESKAFQEQVFSIAKENNMEVINLNDANDKTLFIARPEKFVALFSQANLICTDSFHGCVFSILFEKPFVMFERKHKLDMSSRFKTLFEKLGVEDRRFENLDKNKIFTLDYAEINKKLENLRKESMKYLKKMINERSQNNVGSSKAM